MLRTWPAAGVVVVLALALPQAAGATTFCVHQGGTCPAGQVDKGADLQAAFYAAVADDDPTVSIGAGTYTSPVGGPAYQDSQPARKVTITGAGAGQTILREPASTTAPVLTVNGGAGSTLANLTIAATGAQTVLDSRTFTMSHVAMTAEGATGAALVGLVDSTLVDSSVAVPLTAQAQAVRAAQGTNAITRSTIAGPSAVGLGPAASLAVTGSHLTAQNTIVGAGVGASSVKVDDSLLEQAPGATSYRAVYVADGSDATLRSVTLLGPPAGTGVAVYGDGGLESTLTLQDSIVRGFGHALVRDVFDMTAGSKGSATLDHNDIHLEPDSGAPGTHNYNLASELDVDPGFVDAAAGDYRLRFDSPLIDAGGACGTPCQTIPDLDGLTRPIDGKGTGTPVRDIGAYEYGRRPPVVTATSTSANNPGENVTFTAVGSDPDHGDTLTYAWRFDDGATATGPTAVHAFTTYGSHSGTVTVTDSAGVTASATASLVLPIPPGVPPGTIVTPPPPPKDTTAPSLTKLSLSHASFAVTGAATATSAAAKPKPKPARGTSIRFTLSEAATVTLKVEAEAPGVRSGTRCVAPPKHPAKHGAKPKPCVRYTSRGTLTRRGEKAGADAVAFSGRIGRTALAKGRYRLTAQAKDAAGNVSAAKTAGFRVV